MSINKLNGLTKTELLVLRQLLTGQSNKEIAEKMFVTEKSVKFHITSLIKHAKGKRREQAIIYFWDCKTLLDQMDLRLQKEIE